MSTLKNMFKLQHLKNQVLLDCIQDIASVLSKYRADIPKNILEELTDILEKFLELNDRIDNLRQKNIDNFYNGLRDKLETSFNLEVQDEEEKE